MLRRFGVLYQSGALWSSMTLAENVAPAARRVHRADAGEIREVASLKLALVGLKGFEDFYPSQISGGMQKRAGLARAMALDPEILFFDEPSAGLDPISSRLLDDLILELRDSLGATIVVVTHELASIFAIGNNSIFLDVETPHDDRERRSEGAARSLRRPEACAASSPAAANGHGGGRAWVTSANPAVDRRVRARCRRPGRRRRRGLRLRASIFKHTEHVRHVLPRLGERAERRRAGQVQGRRHRQVTEHPAGPAAASNDVDRKLPSRSTSRPTRRR